MQSLVQAGPPDPPHLAALPALRALGSGAPRPPAPLLSTPRLPLYLRDRSYHRGGGSRRETLRPRLSLRSLKAESGARAGSGAGGRAAGPGRGSPSARWSAVAGPGLGARGGASARPGRPEERRGACRGVYPASSRGRGDACRSRLLAGRGDPGCVAASPLAVVVVVVEAAAGAVRAGAERSGARRAGRTGRRRERTAGEPGSWGAGEPGAGAQRCALAGGTGRGWLRGCWARGKMGPSPEEKPACAPSFLLSASSRS